MENVMAKMYCFTKLGLCHQDHATMPIMTKIMQLLIVTVGLMLSAMLA